MYSTKHSRTTMLTGAFVCDWNINNPPNEPMLRMPCLGPPAPAFDWLKTLVLIFGERAQLARAVPPGTPGTGMIKGLSVPFPIASIAAGGWGILCWAQRSI